MEHFRAVCLWFLEGPWYEVALKVSGLLSVVLILRSIYFGCEDLDSDFLNFILKVLFMFSMFAFTAIFLGALWFKVTG